MSARADAASTATQRRVRIPLIDCDVHPTLRFPAELVEYAAPEWRDRFKVEADRNKTKRSIYFAPNSGRRIDSRPTDGGPAGSDPELMDRQLLEQTNVDIAILMPIIVGLSPDPIFDAALHTAINEWMAETWLSKYNGHGKYRGSLSIPVHNPDAAVREIEKWAGHPSIVQIMVGTSAQPPFGHPQYHPIWEAAARHHLPVAMHVTGLDRVPSLGVGFAGHFIDYHAVSYPLTYGAHLVSLLCQGVFERYPGFRFVSVEGGFSWCGPLLWRLDRNWRSLRSEVPLLTRSPIEYVRESVRFTTQPVEEAPRVRDVVTMYDLLDAEEVLMFATDYPHWDYDDPMRALPRLPESSRERILYGNASELYGLNIDASE
jgi:predicted TIM-barrel fold metal-dependent hydrolase